MNPGPLGTMQPLYHLSYHPSPGKFFIAIVIGDFGELVLALRTSSQKPYKILLLEVSLTDKVTRRNIKETMKFY